MDNKTEKISIRLYELLKYKLEYLAKEDKRSLSSYIVNELEKIVELKYVDEDEREFTEKQERIKRVAQKFSQT